MGHTKFHTEFKNNIRSKWKLGIFRLIFWIRSATKKKEKKKKNRKNYLSSCKIIFLTHWLHIGLIQWKFVKSQGCLNRSPSTDSLSPLSPDVRPFVGYGIALGQCIFQIRDHVARVGRSQTLQARNNRQTFAAGFDERNLSNTKSISELTGWKKCKYKFHEEYSNIPPCFNIFPPISGLIFHRIILSDEI